MAKNPATVVTCYDLLDCMYVDGLSDLTDGKYFDDENTPFTEAQANQAKYLLDEINCRQGSRILDVGCGNGRILAAAEKRGAEAIGITISPEQIQRNTEQGLNAQLINYRDIPTSWDETFDGIIANGSIEHFIQVSEVVDDNQDALYEEMFAIFARLLKPGGKLATTVIHHNFGQDVSHEQAIKGSRAQPRGSELYHYAKLAEDFGGSYPTESQLVDVSTRYFKHVKREDGTQDYHWTSEYWLKQGRRDLLLKPRMWLVLMGKFVKHPKATLSMLNNLLIQQSWMWQFRVREDGTTPTKLFRDTWIKK